jgi:hypothetical protein
MAGTALTTASVLSCPHGGTVTITSANVAALVNGVPLALASDAFAIAGCTFQIPIGTGTVPSPCVSVVWQVTDLRCGVAGAATLSSGSQGVCIAATQAPQGAVKISATPSPVTST